MAWCVTRQAGSIRQESAPSPLLKKSFLREFADTNVALTLNAVTVRGRVITIMMPATTRHVTCAR